MNRGTYESQTIQLDMKDTTQLYLSSLVTSWLRHFSYRLISYKIRSGKYQGFAYERSVEWLWAKVNSAGERVSQQYN